MKRPLLPAFLPALLPVFLPLLFSSMLAQAAPFYAGKTLAHPAIAASQDSAAEIAFIKEQDGVNGKRTVNGQLVLSYGAASRDGDSICYHPNGKMSSIRRCSKRLALDCGKQFDEAGQQTFPGPEGCPVVKKVPFIFGE